MIVRSSFLRLLAAGSLIVVGVFASLDALASVSQHTSPALAARLAMNPGPALARIGSMRLAVQGTSHARTIQERELALQALRSDAFSAAAVRNMGYAKHRSGDSRGARQAMTLAMRMSRRDIGALIWFFEDAARAGKAQPALRYLDLALRSAPRAQEALTPVLTQSLENAEFRREFGALIARNPHWLPQYFFAALELPNGAENIARTIMEGHRLPAREEYREVERRLLKRLVAIGRHSLALDLYRALPAYDQSLLRTLAFNAETTSEQLGSIAWQLAQDPSVTGSFEDLPTGVALSALVQADRSGVVASKLLGLSPGLYSIAFDLSKETDSPGTTVSLQVHCGDSQTVLAQSGWAAASSELTFSVPPTCRAQVVQVYASAPEGSGDFEALILRMNLRALGRPARQPGTS